jgi:D-serine deaminase-like pyridoxal phosphate-dependent protein
MKTAKSIDVARMVLANQAAPCTGITVSTLAEAEYFSAHGITDILYAVGITPQKLDQVAKLNEAIAKAPELAGKTIDELLTSLEAAPEALRPAIRNHGGGYVNHEVFWASMRAPKRFAWSRS